MLTTLLLLVKRIYTDNIMYGFSEVLIYWELLITGYFVFTVYQLVCYLGDNSICRPACISGQHESTVGAVTISNRLLWENHTFHVACYQCSHWQTTICSWHWLPTQQVERFLSCLPYFSLFLISTSNKVVESLPLCLLTLWNVAL